MQKREGGTGLTIVNGGDAGAAEGDFATCLNWCSRPGHELPRADRDRPQPLRHQHGLGHAVAHAGHLACAPSPSASATRWSTATIPRPAYAALAEAMDYIRETRRPFCLQGNVSRLNGHSSSSGGTRVDERDCIAEYEAKLVKEGR